jgi:hypothetical protein
MCNARVHFVISLLLCSACFSYAQSVTVDISIPPHPDPHISYWSQQGSQIVATIANTTGAPLQVRALAQVTRNNVIEAQTDPAKAMIIGISPGVTMVQGAQLFPPSSITFPHAIDASVIMTGMLPEGDYLLCVILVDAHSGAILAQSQCKPFTILIYQSPELIAPANNASIIGAHLAPMFAWTPVVPSPSLPARYLVRVVEVVGTQTAIDAIRTNPPILERAVLGATQLMVAEGITPPRSPMQYAWTVVALTSNGDLLCSPPGYPAPFQFTWTQSGTSSQPDTSLQNPSADTTHKADSTVALVPDRPRDTTIIDIPYDPKIPTTDSVPTTNCICTAAHEWLGGPPISILKNITAYPAVANGEGFAVAVGALATDNDILIQKCMLNGLREKFHRGVGDPVTYKWEVTAGDKSRLIGGERNLCLYTVPHTLKKGETHTFGLSLTVSSANDESMNGSISVTVTGGDTCAPYTVVSTSAPLVERAPRERAPVEKGLCFPAKDTWIPGGGITATVTAPAGIPYGQMAYLFVDPKDPDIVDFQCTSDYCGSPGERIDLSEPLVCTWDDGGAGGSWPLGTKGAAVVYVAPNDTTKKSITFT